MTHWERPDGGEADSGRTDGRERTDGGDGANGRYGTFQTIDGDVVLYDRENSGAWVQSSYAVEVGERSPDAAE